MRKKACIQKKDAKPSFFLSKQNSPFVTFMYTKLGDLFFSRGKFSFFAPEGLNLIQSVAILRSPSAARRSKGEARYQIHARRGKKTESSPRKNRSPSEVYIKSDNRALFTSQRTFELVGGAWECQNKSFFNDKPNRLFIQAVSGKNIFLLLGKKHFFTTRKKTGCFFTTRKKTAKLWEIWFPLIYQYTIQVKKVAQK